RAGRIAGARRRHDGRPAAGRRPLVRRGVRRSGAAAARTGGAPGEAGGRERRPPGEAARAVRPMDAGSTLSTVRAAHRARARAAICRSGARNPGSLVGMPHPSWNDSYASGEPPPWDTGTPDPMLVAMIQSHAIEPGRTL